MLLEKKKLITLFRLENNVLNRDIEEAICKQFVKDKNDITRKSTESSLGILDSISSCKFCTVFYIVYSDGHDK